MFLKKSGTGTKFYNVVSISRKKQFILILFYYYRVIQIVINREDVQGYAAKTVFEALQAPACHENMVKVSII